MPRPSTSRVRLGAAAAILAMGASACAAAPRAAAPVSSFGVHTGTPSDVRAFEKWVGTKAVYAMDYTPRGSWQDIESPSWQTSQWENDPEHHRLVLSVGLLPDNTGDLASGASGAYDAYFRQLARNLISHKLSNTIIRLGWEFNGNWFNWGIVKGDAASSQAAARNYAAAFRHAVAAMRSVPGAHFAFDWCVNNGNSSINAEAAYPGDAYVDYVGIDAYDMVWGPNSSTVSDPAQRWKIITQGDHGLNFWASFATKHHKKLSVPEWGVWGGDHGGGDDPTYVTGMHNWFAAHNVAYESYFNDMDARIDTGRFPLSAATYKKLF